MQRFFIQCHTLTLWWKFLSSVEQGFAFHLSGSRAHAFTPTPNYVYLFMYKNCEFWVAWKLLFLICW